MASRLELQSILEGILGSRNVYFQPPTNVQLKYPCIIYNLSTIDLKYANNFPYNFANRYSVTLIDRNPDSEFVDILKKLQFVRFDRTYVSDNLHHFTFDLYF